MKRKSGLVVFIVFLAILASLAYYSVGVLGGTMAKDKDAGVKLGLDLSGGVSITYQTVVENPSVEDMQDTIYKLQKRVEEYSTESEVYQVGDNRITIEIPGVTDANEILEELGKPGSLEFALADGTVFMTGADIKDAQAVSYTNEYTGAVNYGVDLVMTDEGAQKFYEGTAASVGSYLPIIYDGEVISAPGVKQAIAGGSAIIENMVSAQEAEELASYIRIGSLSLELEELQSEVVGAKLGTEAISTSIFAAIIGVAIIMVFMILVYRIPGLAAALALLIYCGIMIAILHIYRNDITLTLPGIAGIVLSIGMAVDANVVIFARIREEIGAGNPVDESIKIGFKKATTAILDGNITTLIAAIVLWILGTGPIKGFAITLVLGIVLSMVTALFVTRWILKSLYAMGCQDKKFYGEKKDGKTINFVGKRFLFILISVVVIVAGFAGMGVHQAKDGNPLNYSIEFVGGTSTTVAFDEDYTLAEIDEQIVPYIEEITGSGNIQCQKVQDSTAVVFKTRDLNLEEREAFNTMMSEQFGVDEEDISSTSISSTISSEMKTDAIKAVIIATICMLIYIWLRFGQIQFASSAVLALVHDVLVVLAFYALAQVTVGTTFIACMLTIVGYSINATIVVFDRIRENYRMVPEDEVPDLKEITNKSITQTLSRSINTTITTFIMVFLLAILGVSSIREFALPLIVGVVCGGYSSVCIAGTLWYTFRTGFGKKAPKTVKELDGKKKAAAYYDDEPEIFADPFTGEIYRRVVIDPKEAENMAKKNKK